MRDVSLALSSGFRCCYTNPCHKLVREAGILEAESQRFARFVACVRICDRATNAIIPLHLSRTFYQGKRAFQAIFSFTGVGAQYIRSLLTSRNGQLIPSPISRSRSWRTIIPRPPQLRTFALEPLSTVGNALFMLHFVVLARCPYLAGPSPQLITHVLVDQDDKTAPSFPALSTS
jgi:hypothetical protein